MVTQGGVATPCDREDTTVVAAATRGQRSVDQGPAVNLIVVGRADSALAARADELGVSAVLASESTIDAAIALALKRLDELQKLKQMTERTVLVEQAKGILMERHQVSAEEAHALLRRHARNGNLKLLDVADAVARSYLLLAQGA
jgi:AmiR/NasT family two-component response regulator